MSLYHNGLLHTNSSYFGAVGYFNDKSESFKSMFHVASIVQDYQDAIDYARKREIAFYQKFFPGVTDYKTFIEKMREIFNKADRAGQKIARLKNASLKNDYTITSNSVPVNYKITITKEAAGKIQLKGKNSSFAFESDTMTLSINNTADVGLMKEIVNYIKGIPKNFERNFDPFNRSHLYNTSKFDPDSTNTKALAIWLGDELGESDVFAKQIIPGITVSTDAPKNTSTTQTITQDLPKEELPFSKFKKSDIKRAKDEGNEEVIAKINQAREEVKNFLLQRLEVSDDGMLKDAFDLAWNKLDTDFFFEGDNLIKGVLGNPGEFALDVALNYASLANKEFDGKLGHIIGDRVEQSSKGGVEVNRGQGRSDYQIMVDLGADIGTQDIGLQVKNVDREGYDSIEVNTDLGLIAPNLGDDIVTSIANYKFNASIASQVGNMKGFLKDYVEKYIWRALNFNVKDGLKPEHTNTFYFLGGDKLIPVSEIILRLYNNKRLDEDYKANKLMKQPDTTITGLKRGKTTDERFNTGEPPQFTKYWRGNDETSWTPTPENSGLYELLIANIRIKSVLNFASFLQVTPKNDDKTSIYELF